MWAALMAGGGMVWGVFWDFSEIEIPPNSSNVHFWGGGGGILGLFRNQNTIQFYNFLFSRGDEYLSTSYPNSSQPHSFSFLGWGGGDIMPNSNPTSLTIFISKGGGGGTLWQNRVCSVDFELKFQPLQTALRHRSLSHNMYTCMETKNETR